VKSDGKGVVHYSTSFWKSFSEMMWSLKKTSVDKIKTRFVPFENFGKL
jgi:hypothetical protein